MIDNEKLELETHHFDYLILGTDLAESVLGAALSFRGLSCINIDADHMYSGTLKSVNLRELGRLIESIGTSFKDHLIRNLVFEGIDPSFSTLAQTTEKLGFRSINWDLEPKFILSDSPSTHQLVLIGVDDYMSFRPIRDLSLFFGGELQPLPLSKSLLMKTRGVSFKEKKDIIQKIELLQKFVQSYMGEKNVNSIKDFEKEIYTLEGRDSFEQLNAVLDGHHSEVFAKLFEKTSDGQPTLAEEIIKYVLCGVKKPSQEDATTARELLSRFAAFVRSAGVHDIYPYLYPVYGIGDLSQVFSRIGALNNAIFLINPIFAISSIIKPTEIGGHYQLELKQGEHSYTLYAKNLIIGQQYNSKIKSLLSIEDTTSYDICEKLLVICSNEIKNDDFDVPFMAVFPPNAEILGTPSAVNAFLFGSNTQSSKEDFLCLHIAHVKSSKAPGPSVRQMLEPIIASINKSKGIGLKPLALIQFDRLYEKESKFEVVDNSIIFAPSFGPEVTIDKCFSECHNVLRKLGVIKEESDPLVVRKKHDDDSTAKSKDQKLIDELESFKFD